MSQGLSRDARRLLRSATRRTPARTSWPAHSRQHQCRCGPHALYTGQHQHTSTNTLAYTCCTVHSAREKLARASARLLPLHYAWRCTTVTFITTISGCPMLSFPSWRPASIRLLPRPTSPVPLALLLPPTPVHAQHAVKLFVLAER